jgi:hypothetical protein
VAVYDEQPEYEITCDGNDPIEREVYQIFLDIRGNTEAFFDYWREVARQEQIRAEVPQQTAYEASLEAARPGQQLYECMLQLARLKTRLRQG